MSLGVGHEDIPQRNGHEANQKPSVQDLSRCQHGFHTDTSPERYHSQIDVRRFGPGERIVFEPYPQEVFERTRRWIESWDLFPPEQKGSAGYEIAVV